MINSPASYIAQLILKQFSGKLSAEELAILDRWRKFSDANEQKYQELVSLHSVQKKFKNYVEAVKDGEGRQAPQVNLYAEPNVSIAPVHRMHFLRKWGWVAAAVIIIGTTIGVVVSTDRQPKLSGKDNPRVVPTDILPGSEKATLTLADGRTIALDSASTGNIAQQGNAAVVKLADGGIRYDLRRGDQAEAMMNTMRTPRGGQYTLVLPDGTKVWLNAASSITYPAVFVGKDRKIKVTGEVYMEVARDKTKPFTVDIDGQSSVQVLGTSFNVNSYADEGKIITTLVDGSVKVNNKVILKPGYQAVVASSDRQPASSGTSGPNEVNVHPANIDQTLAWKNGIFDFNGKDFQSIMKDVERWYDIQVSYEGKIPALQLRGGINRGVPLSDIIKFLDQLNIKSRSEGKMLIIGAK